MTEEGGALWQRDAADLAWLIRSRQVSSREATEACLRRNEAVNPQINAVVRVLADEALEAADAADRAVARGDALGPLHGVPVTTKVNTDQRGCPTDNGIVAFKDLIATEDSPVVANLRKAGAILFGRTNTPGFSMRWFTDNDLHGLTRNPWNPRHTAGGSSGGAGAAVAAGIGPISQGNDIAGSIRYPAYCNGVAGIRPTFGRVPSFNPTSKGARGIAAQLMAVNGPLARRVRDVRLALKVLSGGDPHDPRWVNVPLEGPPMARPIAVAMVVDPAGRGVHPAIADGIRRAGTALADAGYRVEEIEPPRFAEAADLWLPIGMDDAIAALEPAVAQYGDEGIRKGVAFWRAQWPQGDLARFRDALARREAILMEWQLFMERFPLVLCPVSTEPPLPVGADVEGAGETTRLFTVQRAQLAISVLGLPGAAVPVGLADGLPVGVQIVGGRYREDLCLDAAEIVEARCGLPTPIDPRG